MHCINANEINYSRTEAIKYNGVDIAKNRKTRRVTNFAQSKNRRKLTSYITKYITKNNSEFTHLAWHCSRDYSNLIIGIRFSENEYDQISIRAALDTEITYSNEWFTFIKWKGEPPEKLKEYLAFANQNALSLLN